MPPHHNAPAARRWSVLTLLVPLLLSMMAVGAHYRVVNAAGPTSFTCSTSLFYQATGSPTQLYEEQYSAGALHFTAIGGTSGFTYNALGYDTVDNLLYASSRNLDGAAELLAIDATGTVTDVENFPNLPPDNNNAGFLAASFDSSGDYLATNPGGASEYLYSLNIASNQATTTEMTLNGALFAEAIVDWTYSDGYLWGVDPSNLDIARISPTTGVVTEIAQSVIPSGTYGATWTLTNGDLVFSNNGTGEVYQIAVANPTSAAPSVSLVSQAAGRSTSNNDGASCFGPPVPLSMTKTGPASVAVSSAVTYTLTVTNTSTTNDSSGFTVDDPVPSGFTNVATTTSGCTVSSNDVNCVEGVLDAGDSFAIVVTATSPSTGGAVTNTATVYGNEVNPDPSAATSSVTTDVGFANVSVSKQVTTDTPILGAVDTFTLTATNATTSTADSGQVVVTDNLNAALPYQSSTSSNCGSGPCVVVSGQTVTWTMSDLAPGQSETLQITVDVDTASPVSNSATFTQAFPNSLGNTSGNSNSVTLTPAFADITLGKAASNADPNVGSDDSYTLTATNSASSTASTGATVTDPLPAGDTLVSTTASNTCTGPCVSASGQTLTWTIDALAPGASATLQIVVTVTGASTTENTATFTQTSPNDSGDTSGSSNTVTLSPAYADVTVTKAVTTSTPNVGSNDTFTLTATNAVASTSDSGVIVVTDALPTGLTYFSSMASNTCSGACIVVTGSTVSWTIEDLPQGASATLQVVVTVNTSSPISNTASFTQTTANDAGMTSGSSNAVEVVPQYANLTLTKSASTTTPQIGSQLSFTLTASNASTSTAGTGVVTATDVLPANLSYVSSIPSNTCSGPCVSVSGQTVTWTINDLARSASATLQIVTTISGTAAANNTATFSQAMPNSSGATTGGSNLVTVTPQYADVSLVNSQTDPSPTVGGSDSFELSMSNAGPSDAGQVVVTDVLPPGVTYEGSSPTLGTIQESNGVVTWTIPDLEAAGGVSNASLTIIVEVTHAGQMSDQASFTQTTPNATGGVLGISNTVVLAAALAVAVPTTGAADASSLAVWLGAALLMVGLSLMLVGLRRRRAGEV